MPNRKVHVVTSSTLGAAYALYKAGEQPEPRRLSEALGGFVGGFAGGRLPDVLDPPTTPNHRGRAHSFTAVATVMKLSTQELDRWQDTCRCWADDFHLRQSALPLDSLERFTLQIAEFACRLLAGFLAGLLAGCFVHLALDACTPCCLNVI
jgi:LexA-binding, inner membrane-associated putative hydrolase